ncbi:MAG: DUF4886 domain-containing protein, partial [Oscillospiraceae bacterium]|nr:DUF4886 domain-containing protein [Oscillospiraceae bacterium]
MPTVYFFCLRQLFSASVAKAEIALGGCAAVGAEAAWQNVVLGIAYNGGCSLSEHMDYITDDSASYTYYKNTNNGGWKTKSAQKLSFMIADEDWDIVVMQQASSASGRPATYNDDIQIIMDYVLANDKNPETVPEFAWNMTWAYPVEDDAEGKGEVTINTTDAFKNYYNNDQMTMYKAIVDAVKSKILFNSYFEY